MSNQAGKGDARRPYDREKWDNSPLWKKDKPEPEDEDHDSEDETTYDEKP